MSDLTQRAERKPSSDGLDLRPPYFPVDEVWWKDCTIMDIVDSHIIIFKPCKKKTHALT